MTTAMASTCGDRFEGQGSDTEAKLRRDGRQVDAGRSFRPLPHQVVCCAIYREPQRGPQQPSKDDDRKCVQVMRVAHQEP